MLALLRKRIRVFARQWGYDIVKFPKEGPLDMGIAAVLQGVTDNTTRVEPQRHGLKDPVLRPYRINMHHVGSRDGGCPFPMSHRFFSDVETYIYDADPACHEQTEIFSPFVDHVIVAAVAGADQQRVFHLNYDPYTSSLLPAEPASRGVFFPGEPWDYVLEDVLKPLKTMPVAGESLDTLAKKHRFQVDYLSLDVQGAEYELLAGMSDAILANTVAVMCEFGFLKVYANQRLFDEIMSLLRAKGFFVARLLSHGYDWAAFRSGIGWRSQGFTEAYGDALFFREIASIREHAPQPFAALMKAAFISLCVGNISHALQCLTEAYTHPAPDVLAQAGTLGYIRFLDEMYRLYQAEEHICPPRFSHTYTAEESLARFDVNAHVVQGKANVRRAYFSETDEAMFRRVAPRLCDPSPTAFETLLRKYAFAALADDVAKRRATSIKQTLGELGMDVGRGVVQIVPDRR